MTIHQWTTKPRADRDAPAFDKCSLCGCVAFLDMDAGGQYVRQLTVGVGVYNLLGRCPYTCEEALALLVHGS